MAAQAPIKDCYRIRLQTIMMKLIVLCAVLGVALCDGAPEATAFASAGTSYKYELPGGYASFSSHTPYAAAHVLPVASMEKDKAMETDDKKEIDQPESSQYALPFFKTVPLEDKDAKVPVFYNPFQYKPDEKASIYYVHSAFAQAKPAEFKEDTKYESDDKMEKHEEKVPLIYTHPLYFNLDKTDDKKQIYYYPSAFPGFKPDSDDKSDEKKQVYYYPSAFPGFKPDSDDKSDEKKQVYYYPSAFPGFKPQSDDKSDERKQVYYSPYVFPGLKPSDISEGSKQIYYYPSAFPATSKFDSSDKTDEKKQVYYYTYPSGEKFDFSHKSDERKPFYFPYTLPTTYKFDSKAEIKSPFVYYSSPYYFPKPETSYKVPTYTPQYYYYHAY